MKKFFLSSFFSILLVSVTLTTYATYGQYTDSIDEMLNYKNKGIVLTDRKGDVFYATNDAKKQEFLSLNEISDVLEYSILTAEDGDFYLHNGFSPKGIARSIILNIKNKSLSYGGSTITQQLVKNALLNGDRNFLRKYQEALLTAQVEKNFSKEEIFEMYLNSVYFGEGAIGISEASQVYFSKKASELSLAESAYLASILKSPNYFSPTSGHFNDALALQKDLLTKMKDDMVISKDEYEKAVSEKITFNRGKSTEEEQTAYHAALYVISLLEEKYGKDVVYSGLKVRTTLYLPWQKIAQEEVARGVEREKRNGAGNGAAVVMDPKNGEILALVGSYSWFDPENGRINMATSPRSPGSSFKPIVYALALEDELITPATVLVDRPKTFQTNYKPQNYDRKFRGQVPVRRALANSLNVPSVEVMERVGIEKVLSRAVSFGISTLGNDPSQYGLSLVLGSGEVPLLEMVNSYSTFANEGVRFEPVIILEVEDKFGKKMYKSYPKFSEVISKETSFLISSILSDTKARRESFGNALDIPYPAAVKTGTSESYRDAWTIGYTPNLVVGIWVGNNNNRPMNKLAGSLGAAPIWKALMTKFIPEKGSLEFKRPSGIVRASICIHQGISSSSSAIMYSEYFNKDAVPINSNCLKEYQNQIAQASQPSPTPSEKEENDKVENIDKVNQEIPHIGGIEVITNNNLAENEKNKGDKEKDNE